MLCKMKRVFYVRFSRFATLLNLISLFAVCHGKKGDIEENQFLDIQVVPLTSCLHLVGTTSNQEYQKTNIYVTNKATSKSRLNYSYTAGSCRTFPPLCLQLNIIVINCCHKKFTRFFKTTTSSGPAYRFHLCGPC